VRAPWETGEGPYAPLARQPPSCHSAEPLTAGRPDQTPEVAPAEGEGGQLAFDLAA
jgi:hypothetical protein